MSNPFKRPKVEAPPAPPKRKDPAVRAPRLAGRSFHVRLDRRGFKGTLKSPEEERFLDEALLAALEEPGTPGRIAFDDSDAVIDVETVGNLASLSFWTRQDLDRYPFLRPG